MRKPTRTIRLSSRPRTAASDVAPEGDENGHLDAATSSLESRNFSSAAHLGQEMTVPAFLDETPRS